MVKTYYRTTILIDKELWRKFRIKALASNKSASSLLEDLIRYEVNKKQQK